MRSRRACLTVLRLAAAAIVLALLAETPEAAAPKRVLIVHSFGRDFAPYNPTGQAGFTSRSIPWREVVESTARRSVSVSLGERRRIRFPSVLLQPLGHLSVSLESTVCERSAIRIAQNLPSRTFNLTSRVISIAYRDAIPVVDHEL